MCIRFGAEHGRNTMQKYDGRGTLVEHLEKCKTQWRMTPLEEWPHHLIHTLEGILGSRYIDQDMCKDTTKWIGIQHNFVLIFSFEHEKPNIDSVLKLIQGVIFVYELEVEIMTKHQQQNKQIVNNFLSRYHVKEGAPDEDYPHKIHITDIE